MWRLRRAKHQSPTFQKLWFVFFLSILLAALAGGAVHGYFPDETSWSYRILWPFTLLSIGITAACAWGIAGGIFVGPGEIDEWLIFAGGLFTVYAAVILFKSQDFFIAIVHYLPAMIALLVAAIRGYKISRGQYYIWIICGILIGFLAAFVQQAKIDLHPRYFTYNSAYHLIQAIGLYALYRGSRSLVFRGREQ